MTEAIHREIQPLRAQRVSNRGLPRDHAGGRVFNHPFHFYRGQVPLHDYVDLLGRTPALEARNGAMLPAHNESCGADRPLR